MKTVAFLICLIASFCCQSALADDLQNFGDKMSYFYLSPSVDSFNAFQQSADRFQDKLKGAGNGSEILVAVMIAKISQARNWPINSLAFGDTAKEITEGKSRLAKYVLDDSQVDPTKLDIWWASFFATGDIHFLENIFKFAGLELPKNDMEKMLVVGAATWSFKANCRQHKKVLDFAKQKLVAPVISEPQAEFLNECIAYANSQSSQLGTPTGLARPNQSFNPDAAYTGNSHLPPLDSSSTSSRSAVGSAG